MNLETTLMSETDGPGARPPLPTAPDHEEPTNVAVYLPRMAGRIPFQRAVVFPAGRDRRGRVTWSQLTFAELEGESNRLARGFLRLGLGRGTRVLLLVRPGLDFVAATFALFKVGAVPVLIDPGMKKSSLFDCIREAAPRGMVAVSRAQAVRVLHPRPFLSVEVPITVGPRWFWGGTTLDELRAGEPDDPFPVVRTRLDEPAAILFTSGSTGTPKGVVYEHGMFLEQVRWIRDHYGIEEGEIDMPAFPLFALFSAAMGMTCVIPDMDPTRPAAVDPVRILEAIQGQGVTTTFGSPALWDRVGRYCTRHRIRLPSIRRILMAGAPVAPAIMARFDQILDPAARIHTPYGATESLPVASITHREILDESAARSAEGAGTCVGRPFPGIDLRIIRLTDAPIDAWDEDLVLEQGLIGEIAVRGAVVTREYHRRPEATRYAKIPDGDRVWHRMGDLGYLDGQGRVWFCGRKAHRVITPAGMLCSVPCEGVFNAHPRVGRSALVGVPGPEGTRPVIVVEPLRGHAARSRQDEEVWIRELLELGARFERTRVIHEVLFHPSFPVDTRHNVKIHREELAAWAARILTGRTRS